MDKTEIEMELRFDFAPSLIGNDNLLEKYGAFMRQLDIVKTSHSYS